MTRNSERGSAMLVTMIIIAALLAGAAVLASMQLSSNRSTELTRNGLAALYCAEAGLSSARATVATNQSLWDAALVANCGDGNCATLVEPSWITALNRDIDSPADGIADFTVSIRDNDDDANYDDDSDDTVFIVARCIKYPDSPRVVEQLLLYKPAANPYGCQAGGVNSRGNDNDNELTGCSEGAD
jgi:hypothetical protein